MTKFENKPPKSKLILGWQVTPTLEPKYWLNSNAKAGNHSESHLVTIPAEKIAAHTAIIAQSGSGKSFFLGRLIEEIMLNTKARCLVFDPNADFKKIYEIVKPEMRDGKEIDLWKDAKYDSLARRGRLPHEPSRDVFELKWSKITPKIKSVGGETNDNNEQLKLQWTLVSIDFFADDGDPALRSELYYCHVFVKAIEPLLYLKQQSINNEQHDLINEAENLLNQFFKIGDYFREYLQHQFDPVELTKFSSNSLWKQMFDFFGKSIRKEQKKEEIRKSIDLAVEATTYITERTSKIYFGKVKEFKSSNILETTAREFQLSRSSKNRLEIIDITSLIDKSSRLLAINAILADEWNVARDNWKKVLNDSEKQDQRVPTFIVVDEAHNLIPAEPQTKAEFALREQFRTIVAEGRKYGLFLILVSQRPDKLDPLIISECENRAIMKLSSQTVLDITRQRLGLEDIQSKLLDKCIEFEMGRALLVGPWSIDGPQLLYCASRRTVEGGRNLDEDYWASPEDESKPKNPAVPTSQKKKKISSTVKNKKEVSIKNEKIN